MSWLAEVLLRVRELGPWGPVLFALLYILCAVTMAPAFVLTVAAGFFLAAHWPINWLLFVESLAGIALIASSSCVVNNAIAGRQQGLLAEGARIRAYDPEAMEKTRQIFPAVQFTENPYEAARDADALLIVTEWEQFRSLDWNRVRELMDRPLLLDGRNLLDPEAIKAAGFEYHSVGRPDTSPPLT